MAGKDRPGEVVEEFLTGLAPVALACGLGRVVTLFGDPSGAAVWAGYPLGPAQVANRLEAFHVVDQVPDVDHLPCPRNPEQACIHAAAASCLRGRIVLPKRLIRIQPPGIPDEPFVYGYLKAFQRTIWASWNRCGPG